VNLRSEDTGAEVADDTANAVDSKDIEGLINTNEELELGGEVAADTTNNADDQSTPGSDETSTRGDGNKTGDGTRAETNGGPLLLQAVVEQNPGQTGHGSSQVGVVARHDGTEVDTEGRATVEAEPANPQEDGADDDVGDVVGSPGHTGVLGVASALAEHDGVGKGSGAGGDMDGTATGIVEGAEGEEPAAGVPGPVGDGVIDDGGPDEDEDEGGEDATTVSNSTNGESRAVKS
jgi:hypothetical protein